MAGGYELHSPNDLQAFNPQDPHRPAAYASSRTATLGEINWSFSDSWASNLTALGALLGTILAASGVIPKGASPLSTRGLAGLSLLFGFLVLLAPVLYSAFARVAPLLPDDTGEGPR